MGKSILSRIFFIDCLMRKDSDLTLWKVNYTPSEDDVFWGISIDRETLKVKDVHVDW